MSENLAIEASGLRKSYEDVQALCGVDLRVSAGTVYGLLGPERRGEDDRRPDPDDAAPARRGRGARGGRRRAPRAGAGPRADRPRRPVRRGRREPDRLREPGDGRPALPPRPQVLARARATSCSPRSTSPRRAGGSSAPTRAACAAASTSPPLSSRSLRSLPRRADDRARPPQPDGALGRDRGARRRGEDRAPDHPVPRRGRPPRRPDRGDRPRRRHRRGHLGRAQGAGRRRPARDPPRRRAAAARRRSPRSPPLADGRPYFEDGVAARAARSRRAARSPRRSGASTRPGSGSTTSRSRAPDARRRLPAADRTRGRAGRGAERRGAGDELARATPSPTRSCSRSAACSASPASPICSSASRSSRSCSCCCSSTSSAARSRRRASTLRRLPDARDHRPVDGLRRLRHGARARRGSEEGPHRPLPLAADVRARPC